MCVKLGSVGVEEFLALSDSDKYDFFSDPWSEKKIDQNSSAKIAREMIGLGKYLQAWRKSNPISFGYKSARVQVETVISRCSSHLPKNPKDQNKLSSEIETFRRFINPDWKPDWKKDKKNRSIEIVNPDDAIRGELAAIQAASRKIGC